MSSFSDRRFITFLLFCVAVYVMTQIMTCGTQKEGMDAAYPAANEQQMEAQNAHNAEVQQAYLEALEASKVPVPASTSEEIWTPAGQTYSAAPAVSLPPIEHVAEIKNQEQSVMYNQSAPENQQWYQPPAMGANQSSTGEVMQQINSGTQEYLFQTPNEISGGTGPGFAENVTGAGEYYPDPVDVDRTFWTSRPGTNPQDLYPKPDEPLNFSEYNENPNLNKNFLMNRFSSGISCSKQPRNSILDLRGQVANPIPLSVVSPFNMPTILPDVYRKSLADVS